MSLSGKEKRKRRQFYSRLTLQVLGAVKFAGGFPELRDLHDAISPSTDWDEFRTGVLDTLKRYYPEVRVIKLRDKYKLVYLG